MAYNNVDSLFKQLNIAEIKKVGHLSNPDIPTFNDVVKGKKYITDQAHLQLRSTSQPRNADNLVLPRTRREDPRTKEFLLDHAIDPVYKRAKYDPNSMAPPVSGEGILYGVDKSMREENDSLSLIQRARASFYNYNNRFNTLDMSQMKFPSNPVIDDPEKGTLPQQPPSYS